MVLQKHKSCRYTIRIGGDGGAGYGGGQGGYGGGGGAQGYY